MRADALIREALDEWRQGMAFVNMEPCFSRPCLHPTLKAHKQAEDGAHHREVRSIKPQFGVLPSKCKLLTVHRLHHMNYDKAMLAVVGRRSCQLQPRPWLRLRPGPAGAGAALCARGRYTAAFGSAGLPSASPQSPKRRDLAYGLLQLPPLRSCSNTME